MLRKQIVIKMIVLTALGMLASAAAATEADFEKRMARGVAALDAGNPLLAQEEFRVALTEHPSDPEATFYLAVALNRSGSPAAESALKTALRQDPANPRINLELGTFYFHQKMYEEADDYFETVLAQKTDGEMTRAAEAYRTAIAAQHSTKRWGATLSGGIQYDSNVPLAADGAQLPAGTTRRGDWRAVFNVALTGTALRDSEQELAGTVSLYQTVHGQLSDFNLTQALLEGIYKRNLSAKMSGKLSVGFESIMLGGVSFVNDVTVAPGLFVVCKEGMNSGVEYRLRGSFFNNSDTFTTNTERDGISHALIVSHRYQWSETVNLRASYAFERENTSVATWSSNGHRLSAGAALNLPYAMLLDVSGELAGRRYDEPASATAATRSDTTLTGGFSLTWQAMERLALSAGYHYTNNDSNSAGYSYGRGITSLMVQGRY